MRGGIGWIQGSQKRWMQEKKNYRVALWMVHRLAPSPYPSEQYITDVTST
ncbi:hypothetical protein RE628_22800 [Paenibacillus sp. D2_2]|nr:hypothetical protein [Paenibacillus sp. D2_2]WMT40107.1 hypothetical protein RE628_22800 [Paenibacillus sp. D2_2]